MSQTSAGSCTRCTYSNTFPVINSGLQGQNFDDYTGLKLFTGMPILFATECMKLMADSNGRKQIHTLFPLLINLNSSEFRRDISKESLAFAEGELKIKKNEFSLKFIFSKKATKSYKIFTVDLTLCSMCQIDGEDFVNFCGLLRKNELYLYTRKNSYSIFCTAIILYYIHLQISVN